MAYVFRGAPSPRPRNKPRPLIFDQTKCGTRKGYRQHQNHGIPFCTACREANTRYQNSYNQERRATA